MSQDEKVNLSNVEEPGYATETSDLGANTEAETFALIERVLQRPSGAEVAANSEKLAALAKQFRDKQMAIRKEERRTHMLRIAIVGFPILLAAGLWYRYCL